MYNGLVHAHSGLRYVVLFLLIITIVKSYRGWMAGADYTKGDAKLGLFSMIFLHVQLLLGFALYGMSGRVQFSGMGETVYRFFTAEHPLMMLIAIAVVTIGRAKSKKLEEGPDKHKKIFVFYLIGLVIIFIAIPWPFMKDFGTWF